MSTTTSVSANAIHNMTQIAAHELTKQIQKNLSKAFIGMFHFRFRKCHQHTSETMSISKKNAL
ncbi:hypothetical protein GYH30_001395 [Glycine max]|uniref:Uncharacterized protein n=1 Tax=Glycine max TaxID=3847 RepID=K7K3J5_SOYBN|nr:hypothetical protein GYH30_001395 [Glycine max]